MYDIFLNLQYILLLILQGFKPTKPNLPKDKYLRTLWSRHFPMGTAQDFERVIKGRILTLCV